MIDHLEAIKEKLTVLANARRDEAIAKAAADAMIEAVKNSNEWVELFAKAWSAKEIQNEMKDQLSMLGASHFKQTKEKKIVAKALGIQERDTWTVSKDKAAVKSWVKENMPDIFSVDEKKLKTRANEKDSEIPEGIVKKSVKTIVTFAKDLSEWES